eukprot:scaffold90121_cov30-Tisochrysis_lutea.AAC.13
MDTVRPSSAGPNAGICPRTLATTSSTTTFQTSASSYSAYTTRACAAARSRILAKCAKNGKWGANVGGTSTFCVLSSAVSSASGGDLNARMQSSTSGANAPS